MLLAESLVKKKKQKAVPIHQVFLLTQGGQKKKKFTKSFGQLMCLCEDIFTAEVKLLKQYNPAVIGVKLERAAN